MDTKKMHSIDEMAEKLSDDQKKVLEQFRYDMENSPVRNLNKEEKEIYASAIMKAIEFLPSFRDALAILSPFMDATSSTAYTDKYARVGLSYWFFYLADRHTRAVALLHESMHVLYNHFPRFSSLGLTPAKGNIAGDLEINSNLSMLPKVKSILQDFVLPDSPNIDFPYYKTMEQYSQLLKDKLDEEQSNQSQQGSSSDSGSSDGGSDSSASGDSSSSSQGGSSNQSGQSSQNGKGSGQGQSSQSGQSGSGQGQSSQGGQSGSGGQGGSSQSQESEYGHSYDDYVRRASGQKPLGTPSLEDMMKDNQDQQQYGNGSGDGNGDGGNGGDSSSNDSKGDNVDTSKGSFDDYEKSNKISGPMRTAKPAYRCDHSTPERTGAADDAGIEKKSTTSQNIARRNTKARIVEESKSRAAGSGSANDFLKVASALMDPPKVDWRTLFRRAVAKSYNHSIAGRSHASYKRVNRRSQGSVIFPGMIDYQPTAMFGVDTSGSMGKSDYESLLSEVEAIMKNGMRSKDGLRTFCVDTEIKGIEVVRSVKKLKLSGGGGTEMAAAFRFVNSLSKREQPDIFVLGTDGGLWDGDWKNIYNLIRKAKYTTIILITSDYGMKGVPDYIRQVASVIDVSESEKNLNPYS